jgi:hypothetical protein
MGIKSDNQISHHRLQADCRIRQRTPHSPVNMRVTRHIEIPDLRGQDLACDTSGTDSHRLLIFLWRLSWNQ